MKEKFYLQPALKLYPHFKYWRIFKAIMNDKNTESFLLVSMDEDKIRKVADALSSPTAKAILNFLSERDSATETEISQFLKLPLSTVHYNLKNLIESGLVVAKEFHYSSRGKEVNHYSLAKKYIIITPKREIPPENLKSVLLAGLAVGIGTIALWIFQILGREESLNAAEVAASRAAEQPVFRVAVSAQNLQVASQQNNWLWFLLGGALALLVIIVISLFNKRKSH